MRQELSLLSAGISNPTHDERAVKNVSIAVELFIQGWFEKGGFLNPFESQISVVRQASAAFARIGFDVFDLTIFLVRGRLVGEQKLVEKVTARGIYALHDGVVHVAHLFFVCADLDALFVHGR